jgi:lambda family phage tail tape measure protein
LLSALEGDKQLGSIFDKIMDVAGEFAGDGAVEGPGTGTSDSIPARLSDGEFVFTKKAVDQIGVDNLQKMMDDAERAYDGGLMKKYMGGSILTPDEMKDMDKDVHNQMLLSNPMPSVRKQR